MEFEFGGEGIPRARSHVEGMLGEADEGRIYASEVIVGRAVEPGPEGGGRQSGLPFVLYNRGEHPTGRNFSQVD